MKRLLAVAMSGMWLAGASLAADVHVNESDNGKTIGIAMNQCLVISLKAQGGTGYGWFMAPDSTKLVALYGRTVTAPGTKDHIQIVGGPQTIAFSLCPGEDKLTGVGLVKFAYKRPWEKTTPPAKTFEITVKVGP